MSALASWSMGAAVGAVLAQAEGADPAEAPNPPAVQAQPAGETATVAAERVAGPPFYTRTDVEQLRRRHGLERKAADRTEPASWRCLIADPTCGHSFEVNALAAYSYRLRQRSSTAGSSEDMGESDGVARWSSGRAQYDFWMNLPLMTEARERVRYTRMTLGPKGGVIVSDSGSVWGNVGMAFRYWFGRGRWSPALEFTSALSFKLGERIDRSDGSDASEWTMARGPVGFTADVGVGLGGFGALVLGGQYDSALAREELPEPFHVAAGGAFFIGFRGNIVWGGPVVAALATHAVTQRVVDAP